MVFCVPPSKNEDYVAEVEGALALWSGEGGFVFTSSGGVYAEDNGGACVFACLPACMPRNAMRTENRLIHFPRLRGLPV